MAYFITVVHRQRNAIISSLPSLAMNTHTNLLISKRILSSLVFLLVCASTVNAENPTDSIDAYNREAKYKMKWRKLTPRYVKTQVAGGMGLVSMGFGWDFGKSKQWETDMMIGYIPKFSANRGALAFTLKQNYIPWKVPLSERFILEPLETGLYMNKVVGENFWSVEPEKYDGPYYKFATSIRFSVFFGQRIKMFIFAKDPHWKSISLFYELSTNDLYLISYAGNTKSLSLGDILVLSFGLKLQIL